MGSKERFYADIMALQPEVTGSCNLVIVNYPNGEKTRFVVDCGLFQESDSTTRVSHSMRKTLNSVW